VLLDCNKQLIVQMIEYTTEIIPLLASERASSIKHELEGSIMQHRKNKSSAKESCPDAKANQSGETVVAFNDKRTTLSNCVDRLLQFRSTKSHALSKMNLPTTQTTCDLGICGKKKQGGKGNASVDISEFTRSVSAHVTHL